MVSDEHAIYYGICDNRLYGLNPQNPDEQTSTFTVNMGDFVEYFDAIRD